MSTPDDELVGRARDGNREALAVLLARDGPKVRQSLQGQIPQRWQALLSADDVMQQTYTDAFLAIGKFVSRGDGAFAGWLLKLAQRNLQDGLKMLATEKRGGDRIRVDARSNEDSVIALYEMVGTSKSTPSRGAARREAHAALERAIRALPPTYRRLVRMCDLEGIPVPEVAAAMNRTPGSVYMLRARAHEQLRLIMGGASRFM